jgi:hypothetical protein
MSICHIKVNGDGEIYVLGSHFKLGFGRCFYMKVNLQSGSIEIKNLRDSSDIIILDDNSDINIFGYFGYFNSQIRLNGLAMLATW